MSNNSNWSIFSILCEVLGGQNDQRLIQAEMNRQLPALFDIAAVNDVLPALAVRCNDQQVSTDTLSEHQRSKLKQALIDNTVRNMQIKAQALKITTQLNRAGITPLFLKGTVQLLDPSTKDLGFRKQVDIDLLVEPEQLAIAADIFLAEGYNFCNTTAESYSKSTSLLNTSTAIKSSAAHHHLPPLIKEGYETSVELHRHFLPKRFQQKNPLGPLFKRAQVQQSHGARFLTPSFDHQITHLILGKVVHDGHLVRRTIPIREACDYIRLSETGKEFIDWNSLPRQCSDAHAVFSNIIEALMLYPANGASINPRKTAVQLQILQKRYNSPTIANLLDAHARALHLMSSFLHSPAKLPAYLRRLQ